MSALPAPLRLTHQRECWIVARLTHLFAEYNHQYFGGALPHVPIILSRRMTTDLGKLNALKNGQPFEIRIAAVHVINDGWREVKKTLLHEMVHLEQWIRGHPRGHGPGFDQRCREVGAV